MKSEKAGEYLALISIIIAVLAGLAAGVPGFVGSATAGYIAVVLVILGIIVGLTTITEKEVTSFLITSIVFVTVGTAAFGAIDLVAAPIGTVLDAIVKNIATFVAPAAIIVGFKAVYALASRK